MNKHSYYTKTKGLNRLLLEYTYVSLKCLIFKIMQLSLLNSIKKLKQLFINNIMPCLSLIVTTQKYISLIFLQSNYTMHQRRQWHPTPVLLPGKLHGRRRLIGCSPRGH